MLGIMNIVLGHVVLNAPNAATPHVVTAPNHKVIFVATS